MTEELNTPQTEEEKTAPAVETHGVEDGAIERGEKIPEEEKKEIVENAEDVKDIDGKADSEYLEALDYIMAPQELQNFNAEFVTVKVIDQMITANQLKYVDAILAADEENKLIADNAEDIKKLDEATRVLATKHAMNIENTANPDYFEQHSVADELLGPIQQIRVMIQKRQEVKIKGWKVEYRARLINRLREMKIIKNS